LGGTTLQFSLGTNFKPFKPFRLGFPILMRSIKFSMGKQLASEKHTQNDGKSPFSMGKWAMINGKLLV
jgi:hypothetical protein